MTQVKAKPKMAANGQATTPQDGGQPNRPVHEQRIGRICGAVWKHEDQAGKVWYNVTFCRIYKDDAQQWARSDSFGKGDLPLLMKVADRCHDWMYEQMDG